MNPRNIFKAAALALALVSTLSGCETQVSQPSTPEPVLARQTSSVVGDGRLQSNEECDDGNTTAGDGCSPTGTIEAGFLCHVPGRACSLANLCGNNTINPGEACDDGNTTQEANGCTATCDLSLCGNGALNNREYPNFDQEICDDANRFEGDGCSRLCEVEPGFACTGSPSRCVRTGVTVFNTGVDQNNRRLESGVDPHWFYSGTTTGASPGVRNANDWPQELQTARFMGPQGATTCVYQDFLLPPTTNVSQFRLRIATFNDNVFQAARVNGTLVTPIVVSEPAGQPWQKNIIREFGTASPWRLGLNRIELCNENASNPPNAFRYLFVDAYDDRCGDGAISEREECDDGDTDNGDGCSASCGIEPPYSCTGEPSVCTPTCGNGSLDPGEQCDDANTVAGDGCNASCRVEPGYSCPTAGQACVPTCGNGALDSGEECDDDNTASGDGCTAICRVEVGYSCSGTPSVCSTLCGDGIVSGNEVCDDGNTQNGDRCSSRCLLGNNEECNVSSVCDSGFCNPNGGVCAPPPASVCGNGVREASEQCDDGNTTSGDGCSATCTTEATPLPAPVITGPASGSTVGTQTPPISGTGTPGTTVTVREGDTVVCTATVSATGAWSCTPTTPLTEGPHTLTATATNSTGTTSPASSPVSFTVDLTDPVPAPVITGPAPGSVVGTQTPPISGTATPGTTVTVREGDTVVCTATVDASGAWSCTPATPLADGQHSLTATATNGAGTTSPVSNTDTFRIDTQAPETTIPRGPGTRTDEDDASFEYASNEDGVRYECSLDGREFAPCEESYDVEPGAHTLRVRSIDAAGNVDPTPAEYSWLVEVTRAFAGGGCSTAPASSWLGLLGLLGLRRRNRRAGR